MLCYRADVYKDLYSFPFAPNPDWTTFYAAGSEILEYLRKTTRQFNLDKHVQLDSRVVEATWDERSGQWKLKVDQKGVIKEDFADVFINATGPGKYVLFAIFQSSEADVRCQQMGLAIN